jgi:hypothetical protein
MNFRILHVLTAAVGFASADWSDWLAPKGNDDTGPMSHYYPPVCGNYCGPVVVQQKQCGENDPNQMQCICYWGGQAAQAIKHIRGCELCIRTNKPEDSSLRGMPSSA